MHLLKVCKIYLFSLEVYNEVMLILHIAHHLVWVGSKKPVLSILGKVLDKDVQMNM